jgi:tryptophan-rich sensory protein
MKSKFNFKIFIICLLIVFVLVGGIGSLFTSKNTDSEWYKTVRHEITPPNFVFPLVWNVLFLLISISLYYSWMNSKTKKQKRKIAFTFGINFILNILWSVLFFGLKLPTLAFAEIIILEVSIFSMILVTRKISQLSAWLLVPYLLWVAFASVLTGLAAFG